MLVAEHDGERFETRIARSIGTRLGRGIAEAGTLDPEAIARTLEVCAEYLAQVRELGITHVGAIATSAMRRASDADVFRERFRALVGAPLHVLSGEEEARCAYLGAVSSLPSLDEPVGVLDAGGGSAEYACGRGQTIAAAVSCEIGAVRLTEAFPSLAGGVRLDALSELETAARGYARARLSALRETPIALRHIAVGGTALNVGAALAGERGPDALDGFTFARTALRTLFTHLAPLDRDARVAMLPRLSPQRADIFPAGILVLDEAFALLGADRIALSLRDLLAGWMLANPVV